MHLREGFELFSSRAQFQYCLPTVDRLRADWTADASIPTPPSAMIPEKVLSFPPAHGVPALPQLGPQKPVRIATPHFVVTHQMAFEPFQAVILLAVKQQLPTPFALPLASTAPHA